MSDRTCSVEGCDKPHQARGWCQGHYVRWKIKGDPGTSPLREIQPRRGICKVDGCLRPDDGAHGWCRTHYSRWILKGDPGPAEILVRERGTCSLEGCSEPHSSRGFCAPHYSKWRRFGDPNGSPKPRFREETGNWRGADVGYSTVHSRLKFQRGRAAEYDCAHCGGRAATWAYDHTDPDERVDSYNGFPYSIDLDRYMPLCKRCHSTLDRNRKGAPIHADRSDL